MIWYYLKCWLGLVMRRLKVTAVYDCACSLRFDGRMYALTRSGLLVNETLQRCMYVFTMSSRSIQMVGLTSMYKIIGFVGHGVLNWANEGKAADESPALARAHEPF